MKKAVLMIVAVAVAALALIAVTDFVKGYLMLGVTYQRMVLAFLAGGVVVLWLMRWRDLSKDRPGK